MIFCMVLVINRFPNSNLSPQTATTSILIALPPQVQLAILVVIGENPFLSNQPPETEYAPSPRTRIS